MFGWKYQVDGQLPAKQVARIEAAGRRVLSDGERIQKTLEPVGRCHRRSKLLVYITSQLAPHASKHAVPGIRRAHQLDGQFKLLRIRKQRPHRLK